MKKQTNLIKKIIDINKSIFLSSLIKKKDLTFCNIQITIAPKIQVSLVDDLEEFGIIQVKLECILERNANLIIKTRSIKLNNNNNIIIEKKYTIRLIGKNSKAYLKSTCFGSGQKIYKFNTLQDHQAESTTSNIIIKSVLDDSSKIFCNNMIKIHACGKKADASLENKNIIIGENSRVVSIPMLEIETDDVACKHGAAVSKFNKEHFFYLQSRGINNTDAQKILIKAFLS